MNPTLYVGLATMIGTVVAASVPAFLAYRGKRNETRVVDDAGLRDDTREYLQMIAQDRAELRADNANLRLRLGAQDGQIFGLQKKVAELEIQVIVLTSRVLDNGG